ncbi:hypothetical protein DL98DRAFT_633927 [Cadophora sp. DSE1049]|nr:hypothetical protein DL98DRAFT_633927 [Cadophora sp. DSE1049]
MPQPTHTPHLKSPSQIEIWRHEVSLSYNSPPIAKSPSHSSSQSLSRKTPSLATPIPAATNLPSTTQPQPQPSPDFNTEKTDTKPTSHKFWKTLLSSKKYSTRTSNANPSFSDKTSMYSHAQSKSPPHLTTSQPTPPHLSLTNTNTRASGHIDGGGSMGLALGRGRSESDSSERESDRGVSGSRERSERLARAARLLNAGDSGGRTGEGRRLREGEMSVRIEDDQNVAFRLAVV